MLILKQKSKEHIEQLRSQMFVFSRHFCDVNIWLGGGRWAERGGPAEEDWEGGQVGQEEGGGVQLCQQQSQGYRSGPG